MSALHYAAHDGQLAIVRLLLAHGADARARYPAHLGGAQPVTAARRRGDAELAAALEAAPPLPPPPLGRHCTVDDVTTTVSVSGGGGGEGLGWVIPPDCTELDLSRAGIGAEGARALALALQHCDGGGCGLTALRLSHNQIGDDGARAIVHALGGDPPALGHDPAGAAGAAATVGAEGRGVSLLDLSANGLTAGGAAALAELLGGGASRCPPLLCTP